MRTNGTRGLLWGVLLVAGLTAGCGGGGVGGPGSDAGIDPGPAFRDLVVVLDVAGTDAGRENPGEDASDPFLDAGDLAPVTDVVLVEDLPIQVDVPIVPDVPVVEDLPVVVDLPIPVDVPVDPDVAVTSDVSAEDPGTSSEDSWTDPGVDPGASVTDTGTVGKDLTVTPADAIAILDGLFVKDPGAADPGMTDPGTQPTGPFVWQVPDAQASWLDTPPACSRDDWLKKWFRYLLRFRGNGTGEFPGFVSIGPDAGESVPAAMRDPTEFCDWSWFNQGCAWPQIAGTHGAYSWGDATIWLGWYLATLATERPVIQKLGLPTTRTDQDLYFALQAFNRLDRMAETFLGYPQATDGFFIRDDVPGGFVLDGADLRFPRADNHTGYACVQSSANCNGTSTAHGDFMSQDQVIGMLFGLAFIDAMVPDGVVVQGMDLRHEARAITHRIVMFLKGHQWKIVAPDGTEPPVDWGGSAVPFSNQIAKTANRICRGDFGVSDYRDSISESQGQPTWVALDASWSEQTNTNYQMGLKMAMTSQDWSQDRLVRRTIDYGAAALAIADAVLNARALPADFPMWTVESMLGSAPCGGPCHLTPGCEESPGWQGEHRLKVPDSAFTNVYRPWGEFSGLDYLFAYNLYFLYRGGHYLPNVDDPVMACKDFHGLEWIRVNGPINGMTYDPASKCAGSELKRTFCGRTWAAWLDAAARGEATVFTGSGRWTCAVGGVCTIATGATQGTDGIDLFAGTVAGDTFDARDGDDCLVGDAGNDTLLGGQGNDEIRGGAGNDHLEGEGGSIDLTGGNDFILGGDGADYLKGGPGNDDLIGEAGNDTIIADAGDDYLSGGLDHDFLQGDAGNDLLDGGAGNDELHGDSGDDTLYGQDGIDKLEGGGGGDGLDGGEGNDFLKGDDGDDSLFGYGGNDRLCGGDGKDTLYGGVGADECRGKGPWQISNNDTVSECEDEIGNGDCDNGAFDDWTGT